MTTGSGANMQGMGYIESVADIFNCAKICKFVKGCELVSLHKGKNRCYLKTADAIEVGFYITLVTITILNLFVGN